MHGGTVEARSAGLGTGSEFTVTLPMSDRPADVAAPGGAARAAPPARRRRILVVEDNFDAAELLAEYVGALGHEVTVAHDGPAALAAAERVRPDIVLLDIGLPGMDGYEVGTRLRRDTAAAPVLIALTGYGQDEDRKRSRDIGFAHHLTKPFEPAELERLLAEVGSLPA
jgi:CheY-like chemotaxis protein